MAAAAKLDLMVPGGPRWTASDYSSDAFTKMPYVEMYEYEQIYSQVLQSINNWAEKIRGGFRDAYKGLYLGNETGKVYKLPFYSEFHHDLKQNWAVNQGPIWDKMKDWQTKAENVGKVFLPSAGIQFPKSWEGVTESSYQISFDLINTVNPATDIKTNIDFLRTLIAQNLHVQHDVLAQTPPCIYEVLIPGVRWSPAAIVSGLNISNKGTITRDSTYGIVPDAWGITINIQELITESRNIFRDATTAGIAGSTKSMTVKIFEGRG
jgi:hypothetical protein